ncbi:hypothetical protein KAR91_50230 [Candidatus Pacearchaeota archaeon]|nr:hypothetical protein [Candidatus Pacearchaeota archaeon]
MKQILKAAKSSLDRRTLFVSAVWLGIWLITAITLILFGKSWHGSCIMSVVGWIIGFGSYFDNRMAQAVLHQIESGEENDNNSSK